MEDSYLIRDDSYRRRDRNFERSGSSGCDSSGCYCSGALMFSVSTVCYIITMSVGWFLSRDVIPENHLALAAAIVSTVPLFAIYGATQFLSKCGVIGKELQDCCAFIVLCVECCAAIFEIAGGILFLIVGIHADDNRIKAFGISAAIFGFLSGFSCGFALLCCCCGINMDE